MSVLPWLPKHRDIGAAIKEAKRLPGADERLHAAKILAGFDRDAIVTGRIDKLATSALEGGGGLGRPSANGAKLALLSSHSIEHLLPAIRVAGLQRRMILSVHSGTYGQFQQILLQGDEDLKSFAPKFILLALDLGAVLPTMNLALPESDVRHAISQAVERLRLLWRQARSVYGAQAIQQTFVQQQPSLLGSFDGLLPASPANMCARLNLEVRSAAQEDGVLLLDIDRQMSARVADMELLDPIRWHQAKQLINPHFAPLYGDLVARVVAAASGVVRKCLVLDLDNTLWGGVIGDDGLAGIRLGQGSAEGEAFAEFQRYVAALADAGVILAVCSKNDDVVARAAFSDHPEMVLRHEQVACFTANWSDKASNLRQIAQRINIGLDSLVFVDDNPAEREIIRRELPDVAVPELPEDVAYYPSRLAAAGYFETASLTRDDLNRSRSYAANAERAAALKVATDLDGYLKSLEMRMTARPISRLDRSRAAQLINKSNQYNLTTRRRTELELEALLEDPNVIGYSFRLKDKFGDNGLISVVLARPDDLWDEEELLIDTWLMSCRVLGRGVEKAALQAVARAAASKGMRALIGEFRPSGRNGLVQDHYQRLGFGPIKPKPGCDPDANYWKLSINGDLSSDHYIEVEH